MRENKIKELTESEKKLIYTYLKSKGLERLYKDAIDNEYLWEDLLRYAKTNDKIDSMSLMYIIVDM